MLKAALDYKGKHIEEWSDVLVEVERVTKIKQIEDVPLETDARKFRSLGKQTIDGTLLTLRKERGSATTFKRIKAGKVTVTQIARERGVLPQGALTRYLKLGWRTASEEERREFIKWLRQEVDLDKYLGRR